MERWLTLSLVLAATPCAAFMSNVAKSGTHSAVSMKAASESTESDRRNFMGQILSVPAAAAAVPFLSNPQPASAEVYLDPAMYGDQENRNSAVNSLKEAVRRAVLEDPNLAPSFYQLAILDGLSFDSNTKQYGPDGRVVSAVLSSKDSSPYMKNLQAASKVLIQSSISLKKLTSITIADAVALGGAEAIESIGGPVLSVQLGRMDAPKGTPVSSLNLNVLSGETSPAEVTAAFKGAGLTEREMTALLGGLLTLNMVEKTMKPGEYKKTRGKYRERGKIGRMSEFQKLSDEDIAELEEYDESEDNDWYIAESFGTRDEAFGAKAAEGLSEQNFNKYLKDMSGILAKKKATASSSSLSDFGWIGNILLNPDNPTTQAWLTKYGGSYLNYNKDLAIAYNAITQLGAEYTGGKYESLLKNKPRKTLNDDLDLF